MVIIKDMGLIWLFGKHILSSLKQPVMLNFSEKLQGCKLLLFNIRITQGLLAVDPVLFPLVVITCR